MPITVRFDPGFANRLATARDRAVRQALERSAQKIGAKALERLPDSIRAYHASEGVDAILTRSSGQSR
jgi:hypothetical protein